MMQKSYWNLCSRNIITFFGILPWTIKINRISTKFLLFQNSASSNLWTLQCSQCFYNAHIPFVAMSLLGEITIILVNNRVEVILILLPVDSNCRYGFLSIFEIGITES